MIIYSFFIFLIIYIIRFYLVIRRNDWFILWLGLEINIMIFILIIYNQIRLFNIESCLKYFFIQRIGSSIFIGLLYCNKRNINLFINIIIRYKLGSGPFFFWFPSLCKRISWFSCFILICLQKILPLIIISLFFSKFLYFVVVVGLFLGIFGSFNQKDIKQLIAFSSIFHLRWIILLLISYDVSWLVYLFFYRIIIYPLFYVFNKNEIFYLIDLLKIKKSISFLICILRISGIPPFLGFFLKWYTFIKVLHLSILIFLLLVISSIIIFYVYFRIIYDIVIIYNNNCVWINWYNTKNIIIIDVLRVIGIILGLYIII